MNCKEANEKISIVDFLFSIGMEPKRVTGNNYWYLSPLRNENTPSFKVNNEINRWYDFGIAVGGKLVDFGVRFYETNAEEFLERIGAQHQLKSFSFQKPEMITATVIKKTKLLENKALLNYLETRSIDILFARAFCEEVYFSANNRNYFGIGFKNDLAGMKYETNTLRVV